MRVGEQYSVEETTTISEDAKPMLIGIWNSVYPETICLKGVDDLDIYLNSISETRHLLLRDHANHILAWAYTFNRENERWFSIILSERVQGQGMGKMLIEKLKWGENELNGWVIEYDDYLKIDGTNYKSPLGFYRKCGFDLLEGVRLEKPELSAAKIRWRR